eukprot:1005903_1
MTTAYDHLFKFTIIGDSGVGKSCLMMRFADDTFNESFITTIGVDFRFRTINVDDKIVKLQIWDTAGQETFRSITRSYYRNTAGALLVYDITRRETFMHVSQWLTDAKTHGSSDMTVMLVGNKCDLEHLRQVSTEEGQRFAQENGLLFIETSAKTSKNVEEAFTKPASHIYQRVKDGEIDPGDQSSGVQIGITGSSNTNATTGNSDLGHSQQQQSSGCACQLI